MSFSTKTRVGVLRGGPSPEYEVSLNTGKTILANLPDEYEPLDILISKGGLWHIGGLEKSPYDVLKGVDVVFNAMHGAYGEDGTVQKLFEDFGIPHVGSGSLSSALGMNKVMSKNILNNHGLKTPHHIIIQKSEDSSITKKMMNMVNEGLPLPIIIKPVSSGSSLGVSFVDKIGDIKNALKESFKHSPKLLVEEYKNPGNFNEDEKRQIAEATILIHKALGLRDYSRADFILHPKRGLFVLEVNTLPELTHSSSFIKSLEAVGGNIKEFLSHLLSKTLGR